MTAEEKPPTEAELREADLLARALERPDEPGRDLAQVEDALGAAYLLRASNRIGLTELRARAVLERIRSAQSPRVRTRAAIAGLVATAAALAAIALLPRGSADLPVPDVKLLRSQLAAARPGAPAALDPLAAERTRYRAQVYRALGRAYGDRR